MASIFPSLYETLLGLYDSAHSSIFDTLYKGWGYDELGLTFFLFPLIMFAFFYLVWKYPYGKWWHWFIWLSIAVFLTGYISHSIAYNEIFQSNNQKLINALADTKTGPEYEQFAKNLLLKYTFWNSTLGALFCLFWSIILKQLSKFQTHLPF